MENVKIGTKVIDSLGNMLECVNIDGLMYEMKYLGVTGLSQGSVFLVPSQFGNEGFKIAKKVNKTLTE